VVANRGFAISNSRIQLLTHYLHLGWRVIVVCDKFDNEITKNAALTFEEVKFARSGISLFADCRALISLVRVFIKHKPDLIVSYNAKPVIYGTIASLIAGRRSKTVNTITGLGHAFVKGGVNRMLAGLGYKFIGRVSDMLVFQNSDDRKMFLEEGWANKTNSILINGSGVDTNRFKVKRDGEETSRDYLVVIMVARLIWQKGIREFMTAAKVVKERFENVEFHLYGEFDLVHPDAVTPEDLQKFSTVRHFGFVENIEEIYRSADVFCLPSYREGLPRSILEASACGLPCIAANVPGSRDAVIDGVTGFLVPSHDYREMAERITELLEDGDLREKMGRSGVRFVNEEYCLKKITQKQLEIHKRVIDG